MKRLAPVVFVALLALPACTTVSQDPANVGQEGWVRKEYIPGRHLVVVRSGDEVIVKFEQPGQYILGVSPATFHDPTAVLFPKYPESTEQYRKNYFTGENRFYSVPPGRSNQDVLDWYLKWFRFGGTSSGRGE